MAKHGIEWVAANDLGHAIDHGTRVTIESFRSPQQRSGSVR
jgi:hypothetical protein